MRLTQRERDDAIKMHKEKSFELQEANGNNEELRKQVQTYEELIAETRRKE